MSFQGKQLPAEMVEAVVRLKNHFDDERKMTLWRALNRWGFNHGEGRRRNSRPFFGSGLQKCVAMSTSLKVSQQADSTAAKVLILNVDSNSIMTLIIHYPRQQKDSKVLGKLSGPKNVQHAAGL